MLSPPDPVNALAGAAVAKTFSRAGGSLATGAFGPGALAAHPSLRDYFERVLQGRGFSDALLINAVDPTRTGSMFFAPVRRTPRLLGALQRRYDRLCAHVAAGFRLHRALGPLGASPAPVEEAVLETSGKVAHATGPATVPAARAALRKAAHDIERARGPLRRKDPEEAVAIWHGLVAGRWSLVDKFDTDGRRYLIAHRNDPDTPDPRGLTPRERQVLALAALGQSNKSIAYGLGLSPSAVSARLRRANAKLRHAG